MKNIELPTPLTMSPAQRAEEITSIIAAALIRSTHVDKNPDSLSQRQTQLGLLPGGSVHTNPYQPEST